MSESPVIDDAASPVAVMAEDRRMYLPEHDRIRIAVMTGVEREYCFQKDPGQDFYHLIVPGEVYVARGDEKFCLNCALRRGIVIFDRLYWQRRTV